MNGDLLSFPHTQGQAEIAPGGRTALRRLNGTISGAITGLESFEL